MKNELSPEARELQAEGEKLQARLGYLHLQQEAIADEIAAIKILLKHSEGKFRAAIDAMRQEAE